MLYNLIKKQFPEFVQSNYPAFVAFIQAYYRWMEMQFNQKLESITDIDATTNFVRIEKTYLGKSINVIDFAQEIIVGQTSGARAIVQRLIVEQDYITIYIEYINSVRFADGEPIYIERDSQNPVNNSLSAYVVSNNAIGTSSSQFIQHFKSYLDSTSIFPNDDPQLSLYLKHIKEVYSAKGSEQALVFLLNSIHNTKVGIIYPGDNILKSSDGRWNQDSFITIQLTYGELPKDVREFFVKYETSSKLVEITDIESIASNVYRLYFKSTTVLTVQVDQLVQFKDSTSNVICQGVIVLSPQRISIKRYGKNWRVGQIVVIPGTIRDTLARVTQVGINGELYSLEIIECGYNHPVSQTLDISPYDIRPIINNTSLVITSDPINPTAYNFTLTIDEHPVGISEFVSFFVYDYFKEDYVVFSTTEPYVENLLFIQQFNIEDTTEPQIPDYWADSRATISVEYGTIVKLAGQWDSISGQISNDQIVLQDNNYYQPFSYVIDSDINSNDYIGVANAVHPSGTKLFTNTNLQTFVEFSPSGFTDNLEITQDFVDILYPSDSVYTEHTRAISDSFISIDTLSSNLIHIIDDNVSVSDGITFDYTVTDFVSTMDSIDKSIVYTVTDFVSTMDSISDKSIAYTPADTLPTTDDVEKSVQLEAYIDSVSVNDDTFSDINPYTYNDSVTIIDQSTQTLT